MRYISTRGLCEPQPFEHVLLSGPAPDGGLYLPEAWPQIGRNAIKGFASAPYQDVAFEILKRFVGEAFSPEELRSDIEDAYARFDGPGVAPLAPLGNDLFLLELFHGPTLAFKDIALQLVGRMLSRALERGSAHATVIVATSGDTGSAAIAALGGLARVTLFVLHPKGRVSEVQRRQMTTVAYDNVFNIALEGTFDDAQNIVKMLFADQAFSPDRNLVAVNSINFVRLAAQCVYYFTAASQLGEPATFVVPTGNFGDVFAGEAAMRMGLPVERLVAATNANDILWRTLRGGVYEPRAAQHTLSPSMDIQVASNFERALFEASSRNASWTRAAMVQFAGSARLEIPAHVLQPLRSRYAAARCDDDGTLETIARVHREHGRLIDPHTAVAFAGARELAGQGKPVVVLSTAHPAKFPDAVRRATGTEPPLPPRLAHLYEGEERMTTLPSDAGQVRAFIEQRSEPV